MSEIVWRRTPVVDLGPATIDSITRLVNAAKWSKPSVIFSNDRLGPDTLLEVYSQCDSIVGWIGDKVAASLLIREKEGSLWVFLLAVSPDFQGLGLGESALAKAEEIGRGLPISDLRLDAVDQGKLLQYYRSVGFSEIARITAPVGQWGAEISFEVATMSKPIGVGNEPTPSDY